MSFKFFERTSRQLGTFTFLSAVMLPVSHAEAPALAANPASAQACIGLTSNAERLACYDTLFIVPEAQRPVLVSERQAAIELSPEQPEPLTLKEKISKVFKETQLIGAGPKIDPNASLLDRRWELAPESKLGVWNIRGYQPVYLLPAFWTSDKNETPSSPNPNNTVLPENAQHLTSTEGKFQISLKAKAMENIFGDNGDLWLGYTQSSRWQVYNARESRPFRETNYEPEISLMFRTNYELLGLNGRLLGLTLNHQSNGRADPLSRSWNRVIMNLGFERNNFALMLRPWYRIEEDASADNNGDIKNYIGRGDLTAFYRWKEHDFSLLLRHSLKGGDDAHGAMQFDWAFPINGKLRGHFQLFDGYGESMIDYNHRATYVGLGVSLMNWY